MKKFIFLLTAFLTVTSYDSYAQETPKFEGTKEEAIAILRNSEFLNIVRYGDSDPTNVDRFISEVEKIIPLDQQKHDRLKTQLLSMLQKKGRYTINWALMLWPSLHPKPLIGNGTYTILKDNFNTTEYEKLTEQLISNMTTVRSAYRYLAELQKVQESWVALGPIETQYWIERIYEYFDI